MNRPLNELTPDGSIDFYSVNPKHFVPAAPQTFGACDRRATRMYPAITETWETGYSLPGLLGVNGVLQGPNRQQSVDRNGAYYASDPREYLA